MNPLVMALILALCLWMALCAICGFRRRVMLFFGLLLTGLTINQIWMMVGLNAKLFEPHALMAQAALIMYGICAFGVGWLASRVAQAWNESKVDEV